MDTQSTVSGPPWTVESLRMTTNTHGIPLICTMKKYTPKHVKSKPQAGVILLLGHGCGFLKETWEPVLEDLLKLDERQKSGPKIREAWALDSHSHGEAGILNEAILVKDSTLLNIWDYADAFATLIKSGQLGSINPKLHRVVLCGHSAGAVGVTLATSWFNPPIRLPLIINSLILVDPPIWTRSMDGKESEFYNLVAAHTPVRKDIWPSKQAAKEYFKVRPPWAAWEERVLDKYAEYGVRSLPTAHYPDRTAGVTLTTHRLNENMAYTSGKDFMFDAVNRLNQICRYIPVHLVYGARNDMFERDVQDSLLDEQEGRLFASLTRIEDAGHLVVQEAPEQLVMAIFGALFEDSTRAKQTASRL